MAALRARTPGAAIPSLNTIQGGVLRYAAGINALQMCLYVEQYWYAAIVGASFVVFSGTLFYLFPRFAWYRHWIYWVTLVNVVALTLMLATRSLWWMVVPVAFELVSHTFYEREITQLGRDHNIPREILQEKAPGA
jgi:hypothetical protein